MKVSSRSTIGMCCVALLACGAGGCAGLPMKRFGDEPGGAATEKAGPLDKLTSLGKSFPPDVKPIREQRNAEALAAFERQRDEAQYQAAQSAWRRRDTNACRWQLEKLLERRPEHRAGRLLMIEVCLSDDRAEEALTLAQQLVAANAQDAQAVHALGLAHEAAGDHEAARARFRQAVELDPQNASYAASHELAIGSSAEPESSDPPHRLEVADSLDDAQATFSTVEPIGVDALLERADAALAAGAITAAEGYLHRIVRADDTRAADAVLACVLPLRHAEPELSSRLASEACERWSKSAALQRVRGTAEYRLGHWKQAETALRRALSLDNANPLAYFLMGSTLEKLGKADEAERHLRRARQLDARYSPRR